MMKANREPEMFADVMIYSTRRLFPALGDTAKEMITI